MAGLPTCGYTFPSWYHTHSGFSHLLLSLRAISQYFLLPSIYGLSTTMFFSPSPPPVPPPPPNPHPDEIQISQPSHAKVGEKSILGHISHPFTTFNVLRGFMGFRKMEARLRSSTHDRWTPRSLPPTLTRVVECLLSSETHQSLQGAPPPVLPWPLEGPVRWS